MTTQIDDLFGGQVRELGKSARTRARLMDAAVKLFARDGFEAVSVNEIAKVADVANGTFYTHFKDKDEIAAAVAFGIAERVALRLAEAMVDVDDAIERVCLGTRQFIELACSHPDWGRALARAVVVFRELHEGVSAFARADIQRGVDQGVFKVKIDDVLVDSFSAMVMNAVIGRLRGDYPREAGSQVAELQLRMLGADPARATEAAWREIPTLSMAL